ncbi:MAG: hypothetical protein A2078_13025 [Nitrospirae bacterium GWC2_57_9]|nr:MAG: hypothetical protein A2078_13025 [Nitrospirae bacterium GWC2_57_9]
MADKDGSRNTLQEQVALLQERIKELERSAEECSRAGNEPIESGSNLQTERQRSTRDELTGLANRVLFEDHFRVEIARARRNDGKLALLLLDLGLFKPVSDALGRDAGDELLRQAAAGLKTSVRESDTVAYIGGDEFAILLTGVARPEDATVIVKKARASLEAPLRWKEQAFQANISVGISIFPDDGREIEALLRYAERALYQAKNEGGNAYQFYSSSINSRSLERVRIENQLRQALDRRELRLYYQPELDIDTGRLISVEALLRWQHPELGLLRPEYFMEVAEETGLIVPIGDWTLVTACEQNKAWQEAGYPPVCMTINLSSRQFHQPDLAEKTLRALEQCRLDPQWLEYEITEATAMRNLEQTVALMNKLVEKGIAFSLDDYGTACSSVNQLKRLPIHKLKIDRSFIEDIPHDPDHRAVVRAVIALSHSLQLRTIAEGVETNDQLAFLRKNHCDEVQGYLLKEPLPQERFRELMESYR